MLVENFFDVHFVFTWVCRLKKTLQTLFNFARVRAAPQPHVYTMTTKLKDNITKDYSKTIPIRLLYSRSFITSTCVLYLLIEAAFLQSKNPQCIFVTLEKYPINVVSGIL